METERKIPEAVKDLFKRYEMRCECDEHGFELMGYTDAGEEMSHTIWVGDDQECLRSCIPDAKIDDLSAWGAAINDLAQDFDPYEEARAWRGSCPSIGERVDDYKAYKAELTKISDCLFAMYRGKTPEEARKEVDVRAAFADPANRVTMGMLTLLREGHAYSPNTGTVIELNNWHENMLEAPVDRTVEMVSIAPYDLREHVQRMSAQGLPWHTDLLAGEVVTIGATHNDAEPGPDEISMLTEALADEDLVVEPFAHEREAWRDGDAR